MKVERVVRAPAGREVEELTPLEIVECLKTAALLLAPKKEAPSPLKVVPSPLKAAPSPLKVEVSQKIAKIKPSLVNTLEGVILDKDLDEVARLPVSELAKKLDSEDFEDARYLIFDGIVSQRIVDLSEKKGIIAVIGHRIGEVSRRPASVFLSTLDEL
jgi:hypothetical protein